MIIIPVYWVSFSMRTAILRTLAQLALRHRTERGARKSPGRACTRAVARHQQGICARRELSFSKARALTRITSSTGRTAAKPRSTISCSSAGITITWCTRADLASNARQPATSVSPAPTDGSSTHTRRCRSPAAPTGFAATYRASTHRPGLFRPTRSTTASQAKA